MSVSCSEPNITILSLYNQYSLLAMESSFIIVIVIVIVIVIAESEYTAM